MSDCIFCKIIDGDVPAAKVYEDEHTFAFLDAQPVNVGHTLVVPKEHTESFHDASAKTVAEVMRAAHMLSPHIKSAMDADGVNIHINNDRAAGQKVFHFHVHIIPRHESDGFEPWHGERDYRAGEKDQIVGKIQDQMS